MLYRVNSRRYVQFSLAKREPPPTRHVVHVHFVQQAQHHFLACLREVLAQCIGVRTAAGHRVQRTQGEVGITRQCKGIYRVRRQVLERFVLTP